MKYFLEAGYLLLKRNFRTRAEQPLSEIDLIFLALQKEAPQPLHSEWMQIISDPPSVQGFIAKAQSILNIVFVEVKHWQAYPISDLCYNMNARRQQRMFQTAEYFLQKNPDYASLSMRFDLVIVGASQLRHIEAAFP